MKPKIIFFSLIAIICGTNISCNKKSEEKIAGQSHLLWIPTDKEKKLSPENLSGCKMR